MYMYMFMYIRTRMYVHANVHIHMYMYMYVASIWSNYFAGQARQDTYVYGNLLMTVSVSSLIIIRFF